MRQNAPQRRGRGRPSGRRGFNNSPNRSYDSSGPEVKVRGTASAVYDKYQALGRDAILSGDRVAAENYFQHAEHYYRLVQAAKQQAGDSDQRDNRRQEQQNRNGRGNDRAAGAGDGQGPAVAEEAVVEVTGGSRENDTENGEPAVVEDTPAAGAFAEEAGAPSTDEMRETPQTPQTPQTSMNPAELAAMSEGGRKPRTGHGANGRDGQTRGGGAQDAAGADAGADTAEAAPRRQPRRRRRPAADTAAAESDSAPVDVAEDVEPS
jgi:hypothetical protein